MGEHTTSRAASTVYEKANASAPTFTERGVHKETSEHAMSYVRYRSYRQHGARVSRSGMSTPRSQHKTNGKTRAVVDVVWRAGLFIEPGIS
jgi:hypothetical protein